MRCGRLILSRGVTVKWISSKTLHPATKSRKSRYSSSLSIHRFLDLILLESEPHVFLPTTICTVLIGFPDARSSISLLKTIIFWLYVRVKGSYLFSSLWWCLPRGGRKVGARGVDWPELRCKMIWTDRWECRLWEKGGGGWRRGWELGVIWFAGVLVIKADGRNIIFCWTALDLGWN